MKRPCSLCRKLGEPEQQVYSAITGNRYCRDTEACDKRSKRLKKLRARAAGTRAA